MPTVNSHWEGFISMLVKLFPGAVDSIRGWLRHRTKRKAMLMATDEISHSPDDMLSDIGISRDEITCAFQNRRAQSDRLSAGAHGDFREENY